MATDVPMPKLGLTMEEATILEWLVPDGAEVDVDQPILAIETDKTETEVGAPAAGRLHQIGRPGDVYACGARIAVLLSAGETPPVTAASSTVAPVATTTPTQLVTSTPAAPIAASGRRFVSPNARRVALERGVPLAAVRGTGPGGRVVSEDVEAYVAPIPPAMTAGVRPPGSATTVASVAARQLADLLGVDLSLIPVDPVERRVTRDGVVLYVRERLAASSPSSSTAAAVPEPAPLLQEPTAVVRLAGMRGTIAKRMTSSLREMAQLTLTMDADLTAVLADRAERKARSGESVPSVTDYVVAAAARALVRHPYVNAQVTADRIAILPEVHVGLAVAVSGGLLVPVVRDTAHRDLADLAAETSRVAALARTGSLSPSDLEGGTFSVSALGAFGVDSFTPVINPPNAGILGVGRLRDDLVLRSDGGVATVKRLTLSLTWDHRVFDGVPAAEFARTIVELLAEPAQLDRVAG